MAIGNVQGDGRLDLVTGTGSFTQVVTLDGHDLHEVDRQPVSDPSFRSGVRVGTFDWDGDGREEVLLGAAAGGTAKVTVADPTTGTLLGDFFPYDVAFLGGVWVS